jgi:hypothetical protein
MTKINFSHFLKNMLDILSDYMPVKQVNDPVCLFRIRWGVGNHDNGCTILVQF